MAMEPCIKWKAIKKGNTFYAGFFDSNTRRYVFAHNLIMNPPEGFEVDHIDGNGLNNQRSNLRIVTHRMNCVNRREHREGKLPGITWSKRNQKWIAYIQIDGKRKQLGSFDDKYEAYNTYVNAFLELL